MALGNEAVSNDIVASAHVENYAMKLFMFADTEDRKANFNKWVSICVIGETAVVYINVALTHS